MKLLLTSAGITNDAIADALENLVGKSFSEMKVLFVTTAANTSVEDKGWLTENIFEFTSRKPKSFDLIDIAGLPYELWEKHFVAADLVCVGCGDESYLSRIFAEQGVKDYLRHSMINKVYMGISAGSMVAGIFLPKGLNKELYGEECESDYGIGMEFFDFTFIPHLNSPYFLGVTNQSISNRIDKFKTKIVAVDDFTAVSIINNEIMFIGDGERLEIQK